MLKLLSIDNRIAGENFNISIKIQIALQAQLHQNQVAQLKRRK